MDIEKFTRAKCAAFDVASSASVAIYNTNPGSESDLAFHEKSMTDSFHRLASALGYVAMTQAGHDNLLGFVEEVRDFRPDVISGRAHDPQDEVPDMIEADTFYAFQEDAAKFGPETQREGRRVMGNAHPNTTEASADLAALSMALTNLNNVAYAAWHLARHSNHPLADRIGSVAHATDSIKDAF